MIINLIWKFNKVDKACEMPLSHKNVFFFQATATDAVALESDSI